MVYRKEKQMSPFVRNHQAENADYMQKLAGYFQWCIYHYTNATMRTI